MAEPRELQWGILRAVLDVMEKAPRNTIWFSPDQRKPSDSRQPERRRVSALLRGSAGFINLSHKELSLFL